jgi:hypothetical protein
MRSLILAFVFGAIAIGVMPSVSEARHRKQRCHTQSSCAPCSTECGQMVPMAIVTPAPRPVVYQQPIATYQPVYTTDCGGCGHQRGHRRR